MSISTGFRKKMSPSIPPDSGGFAVVGRRLCPMVVALLALALLLPTASLPAGAQSRPAAADQDGMVKDVVTLDSEINGISGRLAELEERSARLEGRIGRVEDEISTSRRRLAVKRGALAARTRSIYVNGRSNTLVMLMSSEGVDDFIRRSEYLENVNRRDAQLVVATRAEAARLEASLGELRDSKAEIDRVASDLRSRKKRLVESRAEKRRLLAGAGAAAGRVQEQSARVEAKMERLNPEPAGRPTGRVLVMVATAYSPEEPGLTDTTASGLKAQRGVVAVDPRVIPLGTRVHVEGYGNAIAADTGSAIKGMRIDLCFDTLAECNAYGRRTVRVTILE